MGRKHLLVVDDQAEIGAYIKNVAEPMGYEVTTTVDATSFMRVYNDVCPDTIVMDVFMPEHDGIELVRELIQAQCRSRILVVSGSDEFFLNSILRLAEAQGFSNLEVMRKPLRLKDLRTFLTGNTDTKKESPAYAFARSW